MDTKTLARLRDRMTKPRFCKQGDRIGFFKADVAECPQQFHSHATRDHCMTCALCGIDKKGASPTRGLMINCHGSVIA